jgi:hypothetical protein
MYSHCLALAAIFFLLSLHIPSVWPLIHPLASLPFFESCTIEDPVCLLCTGTGCLFVIVSLPSIMVVNCVFSATSNFRNEKSESGITFLQKPPKKFDPPVCLLGASTRCYIRF